ncbi:hypothetical protein [Vibrio sp. 1180_3]|uniref:hypothetical protein n=1 Tax=Vibrio sp. 1180_3 TaxID=2528832 RepID=UPI002405A607|nr:hypothetical protein [Vibrio sp. 1180_3]MDF9399078.1 hypothetical protein [Vibrio sp. 1180_3]
MKRDHRYYSIFSNTTAPSEIRTVMYRVAASLADKGYVQRSGGNSVEKPFISGATILSGSEQKSKIMLPWDGFGDQRIGSGNYVGNQKLAQQMAKRYLKGFNRLKPEQRLIVARQVYVLLGKELKQHSEFLLCYTDDGATSHIDTKNKSFEFILRLASNYGIRVFNFRNDQDLAMATAWLERIDTHAVSH